MATPEEKQQIVEMICALMVEGQTLTRICTAVEGMPKKSTLLGWLAEDKRLADQYARARELQADHFAEEIIDIADTEPDPQVARVRMDARKWHASKTAPKKYGDRVTQEVVGDPEKPVEVGVTLRPSITREEWLKEHGLDTTARAATSGA